MPFLPAIPAIISAATAVGAEVGADLAILSSFVAPGALTAADITGALWSMGLSAGLNALSGGLRGGSSGVSARMATSPVESRRVLLGRVWTPGSSMGHPITYDASNKKCFMLIAIADHQCDAIEQVYVDGYPAQLDNYDPVKGWQILYTADPISGQKIKDFRVGKPKFYIQFHMGTDTQVADQWMVNDLQSLGKWDGSAVAKNVCYARVYCYYDSDLFSGFPTFNFVVRGLPVYNPANDTTVGGSGAQRWGDPSTYEWSGNFAVLAYNLARGIYVGGSEFYGAFYRAEDVPLDFTFAAISACDEQVALKAGGTEPRYHGGFEIEVTKPVRDALKTCQDGMAGRVCTDQGQLLIYAGVAQNPVYTFSDADMVVGGAQSYEPLAAMGETKNIVTGKFTDASQMFATVDAPPRRSSDDIAADADIPLVDPINRPQIQPGPTMQRVMEIERKRGRAAAVAVRTLGPAALNARTGQWIAGQSRRWNGTKWFEIVRPEIETSDDRVPSVTMLVREVPANLEEWNPANDELDGYTVWLPSAAPPDPLAATGIFATPLSELGEDGSTTTGIFVGFDPVDDPTAAGGWVKWRLVGSNVEHLIIVTADQLASGKISIYGLAGNTTYEYAVLISGIPGRSAVWSDWYLVTTAASQQTGINDANSSSIREVLGILDSLVQSLNETALITTDVRQTTRRQIKVAQDNLTASFTEQINAEISARQALATLVEQLTAQVGDISAEGLFAVDAEVNDSGAQATIGLRAKVADSLVQATAALLLHSEIVSGVARSWAAVRAGSFYVQDDSGNNYAAFRGSDGALIVDRIISGSLSTGKVYAYGDGTTAKSAEDDTPIPADPASIDLSAGKSVYYYDGNEYAAHGIPGFPVDTTANYIKVEGRFPFIVRTSASSTPKAAIEAYDGSNWTVVGHSVTPTHTANTDTPAFISAKAILPNGTTHWRARIWNPTGNIIQLQPFIGFEDKQQK